MKRPFDASIPRVVLVVLVVATVAALVVAAGTSSADFSVYNSKWQGTSELRSVATESGASVEVASETSTYASVPPRETVAFVLSPNGTYGPEEVVRVSNFVQRGGTLVVAADRAASANELLGTLGASARIAGPPVRDQQSNYRSASLPVATEVADHPVVAGVDSLTLNYGTAVRPNNATILINTSEYAYLDVNRNEALDNRESLGPRPVVTTERVGQGRVVVVGDSSVFINAMLDREGNRQFATGLLSNAEYLLLDYSHAEALPPVTQAMLAVQRSGAVQLGLGAALLGAVAILSRRPDLGGKARRLLGNRRGADVSASRPAKGATREELVAHLERRHPDWDPHRVERVVTAVERRREANGPPVEGETDENSRSSYQARRGRR